LFLVLLEGVLSKETFFPLSEDLDFVLPKMASKQAAMSRKGNLTQSQRKQPEFLSFRASARFNCR
jgi:hypothetical protein